MTADADNCVTDCDSIDRRTALRSIAGGAALVAGLGSHRAWAMTAPVGATAYGKVRGTTADGIHIFKGVRCGQDNRGRQSFAPRQCRGGDAEPSPECIRLQSLR